MLISVITADGDPWMWTYTRRICRAITAAALDRVYDSDRDGPHYAACILGDRPGRRDASEALSSYIYQIGPNHSVALLPEPSTPDRGRDIWETLWPW